jgi:hypothetical protein
MYFGRTTCHKLTRTFILVIQRFEKEAFWNLIPPLYLTKKWQITDITNWKGVTHDKIRDVFQ